MKCLHCGQRLGLMQRLTGDRFCSSVHAREYSESCDRKVIERLWENRRPVEDITEDTDPITAFLAKHDPPEVSFVFEALGISERTAEPIKQTDHPREVPHPEIMEVPGYVVRTPMPWLARGIDSDIGDLIHPAPAVRYQDYSRAPSDHFVVVPSGPLAPPPSWRFPVLDSAVADEPVAPSNWDPTRRPYARQTRQWNQPPWEYSNPQQFANPHPNFDQRQPLWNVQQPQPPAPASAQAWMQQDPGYYGQPPADPRSPGQGMPAYWTPPAGFAPMPQGWVTGAVQFVPVQAAGPQYSGPHSGMRRGMTAPRAQMTPIAPVQAVADESGYFGLVAPESPVAIQGTAWTTCVPLGAVPVVAWSGVATEDSGEAWPMEADPAPMAGLSMIGWSIGSAGVPLNLRPAAAPEPPHRKERTARPGARPIAGGPQPVQAAMVAPVTGGAVSAAAQAAARRKAIRNTWRIVIPRLQPTAIDLQLKFEFQLEELALTASAQRIQPAGLAGPAAVTVAASKPASHLQPDFGLVAFRNPIRIQVASIRAAGKPEFVQRAQDALNDYGGDLRSGGSNLRIMPAGTQRPTVLPWRGAAKR